MAARGHTPIETRARLRCDLLVMKGKARHHLTAAALVRVAIVFAFIAGVFVLHAGTALAHHDQMNESANCDGWHSEADYVGGGEDREVVVDVTVAGEHIAGTFYFDAAHLGHQASYVLYTRSGNGSVDTSGSISMYSRGSNGHYNLLDGVVHPNLHFDAAKCSTPTNTATATPVPTHTPQPTSTTQPTRTATSTSTPKPTRTATGTAVATNTATAAPTDTPRPADTPVPSATPSQPAATLTATAPAGGSGPTASATPPPPTSSPVPTATNTEVSIVLESVRPPTSGGASPSGPGASFLPDTGLGPVGDGIAAALIALAVLAAGAIGLMSLGLRLRRRAS